MKKAQFNFVWIFAIIVGGAILFLAVFGAMKAGNTARYQSDTEVAKSISIITDPLQAGFSEGSFGRISFQQETRINNICFSEEFGKNVVSVATRSDVGSEWNLPGGATTINNKYIFSSEKSSGKDFYVFSKPFYFPYKVADLTFLISDNYCFIGVSKEIADEIIGLNIPNIEIEDCTLPDSIEVCFGGEGCDVDVYGSKVVKGSEEMEYVGNLMYAAIFSDRGIYECNIRRLMYRTGMIAREFIDKADLMDARNCNTNLKRDLIYWRELTINATADELNGLYSVANVLGRKNDREICGLWN